MKTELDQIREFYENHKAGFINQRKFYSVLIPLVEIDGDVHLLFETRATDLDAQPGEICFPGGAVEEGETPLVAALRETCEEIGVAESDIEIIGEGDMLTHNPRFLIYTYVGLLKNVKAERKGEWTNLFPEKWRGYHEEELSGLAINRQEVEDVFTIPLQYFMDHPPRVEWIGMEEKIPEDFPYDLIGQTADYNWHRSKYSVLLYDYPGRYLWGMTAKMALHFAESLKGKPLVKR